LIISDNDRIKDGLCESPCVKTYDSAVGIGWYVSGASLAHPDRETVGTSLDRIGFLTQI
jgi:hypothetical protein